MEDYGIYKRAALALKEHLKWLWENVEQKLEYLKGETQTFDEGGKSHRAFVKKVLSVAAEIAQYKQIESREWIFVDNLFADRFEEYFTLLRDYGKLQEIGSLQYNDVFENAYLFIANARAALKKTTAFLDILEAPLQAPDGARIKDDRVEITIDSIKTLMAAGQDKKKAVNYKPLLFLRIFGYPTLLLTLATVVIAVIIGVSLYTKTSADLQDLAYLQQESWGAYDQAREARIEEYAADLAYLIITAAKIACAFLLISLIYRIAGRIVMKKLLARENKDAELLYYISWFYVDLGLFLIKHDMERHKLLVLEAAEEGYEEAILHLGRLYERGYFTGKKAKMSKQEGLQRAMQCYKQVFPNKRAVCRYNALERRMRG